MPTGIGDLPAIHHALHSSSMPTYASAWPGVVAVDAPAASGGRRPGPVVMMDSPPSQRSRQAAGCLAAQPARRARIETFNDALPNSDSDVPSMYIQLPW